MYECEPKPESKLGKSLVKNVTDRSYNRTVR
jgi:hypothetical protein